MGWDNPDIKLLALKGNHEEMMIQTCLYGDSLTNVWLHEDSGGWETVVQLGDDIFDYARWLDQNLHDAIRTEKHFFVHAGIMPEVPLDQQIEDHTLWIGKRFLEHRGPKQDGRRIVHGHTPHYEPVMLDYRLGLDTGCVYGGDLTAAIFNEQEDHIGFIKVPFMT